MEKMKFRGLEIEAPRKKSKGETEAEYNSYVVEHLKKYYKVPGISKMENETDVEFSKRKQESMLKYFTGLTEMAEELTHKVNDEDVNKSTPENEKIQETDNDKFGKRPGFRKRMSNAFRAGKKKATEENKEKRKRRRKKKTSDEKSEKKEGIFTRIKNFFTPGKKKTSDKKEVNKEKQKKKPNMFQRFFNLFKRDKEGEKQVEYAIEETDVEKVEKKPGVIKRFFNRFKKDKKKFKKSNKNKEEVEKVQKELDELKKRFEENEKSTMSSLDELKKLREECIRLQEENNEIRNIQGVQPLITLHEQVKRIIKEEEEEINNPDIKNMVENYVKSQMVKGDAQAYYAEKYPFYQEKTREEYAELADFYINLFNGPVGYNMLECAEREIAEREKQKTINRK